MNKLIFVFYRIWIYAVIKAMGFIAIVVGKRAIAAASMIFEVSFFKRL